MLFKKSKLILFFLIVLFLLYSLNCKKSSDRERGNVLFFRNYDTTKCILTNPIDKSQLTNYNDYYVALFDDNDKKISIELVKSQKTALRDKFNDKELLIKREVFDYEKLVNSSDYFYNKTNLLEKEEWHNFLNNDIRITLYEYDNNNNATKQKTFYNNKLLSENISIYGKNNRIEEKKLIVEGKLEEGYKFYYFNNDSISKKELFLETGLINIEYYRENGKLLKIEDYDGYGKILKTTEYDNVGKPIPMK